MRQSIRTSAKYTYISNKMTRTYYDILFLQIHRFFVFCIEFFTIFKTNAPQWFPFRASAINVNKMPGTRSRNAACTILFLVFHKSSDTLGYAQQSVLCLDKLDTNFHIVLQASLDLDTDRF